MPPPYDSESSAVLSCTSAEGSFTGISRSTTWSSSVKTAALAPIPSATDVTAMGANSGDFRRLRAAYWMSWRMLVTRCAPELTTSSAQLPCRVRVRPKRGTVGDIQVLGVRIRDAAERIRYGFDAKSARRMAPAWSGTEGGRDAT